jgi:hypothetical protein
VPNLLIRVAGSNPARRMRRFMRKDAPAPTHAGDPRKTRHQPPEQGRVRGPCVRRADCPAENQSRAGSLIHALTAPRASKVVLAEDGTTDLAAVSPTVVASPRREVPAMARCAASMVVEAARRHRSALGRAQASVAERCSTAIAAARLRTSRSVPRPFNVASTRSRGCSPTAASSNQTSRLASRPGFEDRVARSRLETVRRVDRDAGVARPE